MRSHFILYVADQAESTRYYRSILDIEPTLFVPGMTEFSIGPDTVLGLMPQDGAERLFTEKVGSFENSGNVPRAEIYLIIDEPASYHERAILAGGREISPMQERDWGHRAAYSIDPDGYVLAFANEIS